MQMYLLPLLVTRSYCTCRPSTLARFARSHDSPFRSASYWPAYYSEVQPAEDFPWKQNDLAYYFLTITNKNGTFSIGPGQFEKDIKTFTKAAKKNKVKSLFSIGGWDGSQYISDMVATDKNRKKFAKEIKAFMKKYSFDGVDLGSSITRFSSFVRG